MKCNTIIEIDDNTLNNSIQRAVSDALKKSNIQDKLYSYGTSRIREHVDKSYRDGRLVQSVAKEMSKNIPINEILKLLDVEKIEAAIIDNVSTELIKRLQDKLMK